MIETTQPVKISIQNYAKYSEQRFLRDLSRLHWESVLSGTDVDKLCIESYVVCDISNYISYSSNQLNFFLFGDDTNLLYADKNFRSLELTVNRELAIVCNWLMPNKPSLNTKKSNFVIFRPYQK